MFLTTKLAIFFDFLANFVVKYIKYTYMIMMKNIIVKPSLVAAASLIIGFSVSAQGIDGDWRGKLEVTPQASPQIVFHISDPGASPQTITMDSPDQAAYGIPTQIKHLSPDSVSLTVDNIGMAYSGKLKDGKIYGTFSQGMLKKPMELSPDKSSGPNRPQTPQPPFPYSRSEVKVKNPEANVTLSGILTIPQNADSETPVVVLVSGSGLQNRDEEIFGHKPFAVIADRLARNGIASLRYDDRGYGESSGDGANATTADNASDAAAALEFVRKQGNFGKAGILGHSEGGLVAFMLGSGKTSPDFIITLAGPALRGDSIIMSQNLHNLTKNGMPKDITDSYMEALEKTLQHRIDNPGTVMTEEFFESICPEWDRKPIYSALVDALRKSFAKPNPWTDFMIGYSPASDMRATRVPALMLYGDKDTQVDATENSNAATRNIPKADIKIMPGLNHLFQHATTGDVTEYQQIEETMSEEVLDDIVRFIRQQ